MCAVRGDIGYSECFGVEQERRQRCVFSPLLLCIVVAAENAVALRRFRTDADIRADLVYFNKGVPQGKGSGTEEEPAKVMAAA